MGNTKIALITGGSRGLGKDMALSVAKKGVDVVLTYKGNEAMALEYISRLPDRLIEMSAPLLKSLASG